MHPPPTPCPPSLPPPPTPTPPHSTNLHQPPLQVALLPVLSQGAETTVRVGGTAGAERHSGDQHYGGLAPARAVFSPEMSPVRLRRRAHGVVTNSHPSALTLPPSFPMPLPPPPPSTPLLPPPGFADERMVRTHEAMKFTLTDERLHVEPSFSMPLTPSPLPPPGFADERMASSLVPHALPSNLPSHSPPPSFFPPPPGFADEHMVRLHEDMHFTAADERSGKQLRINFYWVDGIYRNCEYGCS
ncbi:unnamed protein product [Closterium sp. NIES-54]